MMTTDVATQDQAEPKRAVTKVEAGGKLAAFVPQTLEEAWRLAGALANSGMTPKSYGSDQNKIMVGMMAGAEVGLTPMAALQSIAVIGNNPSLWGDGALGLVQASGLLEDMDESDDGATATCTLRRTGRATPIVRTFSIDDAKQAGLQGKSGPWTQYPARMRQMRARAFALRDGFADVLRGLHIAEEVRDYAPMQDGGALGTAATGKLTAQVLLEQAAPPEPADRVAESERQRFADMDGDTTDEPDPRRALTDDLIARFKRAELQVDFDAVAEEWARHRDAMPDDLVELVDNAEMIAGQRFEKVAA